MIIKYTEKEFLNKIFKHMIKLVAKMSEDELMYGGRFIELTDRKMEVICPTNIIYENNEYKIKSKDKTQNERKQMAKINDMKIVVDVKIQFFTVSAAILFACVIAAIILL